MTEIEILKWINDNLGKTILEAIWEAKRTKGSLLYTQEWLSAMTMRETGEKIVKLLTQGHTIPELFEQVKGDYCQRAGESAPCYHGFHFMQIDNGSFPAFIKSGDWKDPLKGYKMAIEILEGKRIYLQKRFPQLQGDTLCRAITAAYNCGEGNVSKTIDRGLDVDAYTANHNYSREVWRFRALFNSLQQS